MTLKTKDYQKTRSKQDLSEGHAVDPGCLACKDNIAVGLTFCNWSGPKIIRKHDQNNKQRKKNLCRNWYFWGHHQHFMVFGLQTIAFNGFSMVFGHSTISIKFYSAHTPLLSMSFPWFLGHSTIDFNSHVPSMMGRRNCFDGPFTSNFHWHCFWTFLNELL